MSRDPGALWSGPVAVAPDLKARSAPFLVVGVGRVNRARNMEHAPLCRYFATARMPADATSPIHALGV